MTARRCIYFFSLLYVFLDHVFNHSVVKREKCIVNSVKLDHVLRYAVMPAQKNAHDCDDWIAWRFVITPVNAGVVFKSNIQLRVVAEFNYKCFHVGEIKPRP